MVSSLPKKNSIGILAMSRFKRIVKSASAGKVKTPLPDGGWIEAEYNYFQYFDKNGNCHRSDGPSYYAFDDDVEIWEKHGVMHRIGGPAYIDYRNGYNKWYLNGELHRTDGPAVTIKNSVEKWYLNGKKHRTDGPAVVYASGKGEYWVNDKYFTKEEFEKHFGW